MSTYTPVSDESLAEHHHELNQWLQSRGSKLTATQVRLIQATIISFLVAGLAVYGGVDMGYTILLITVINVVCLGDIAAVSISAGNGVDIEVEKDDE